MADGTTIVGVAGILTTGVLAPMIASYVQKDREVLTDTRAAIDAAIVPLTEAQAQVGWLWSHGFDEGAEIDEVDRRLEELLKQSLLVEAHAVKLSLRFNRTSKIASAYGACGGALNSQGETIHARRYGQIGTVAVYKRRMDEGENVFHDAYVEFIDEATKWHRERRWPFEPWL